MLFNLLHYVINRFFLIPLALIAHLGWWGAYAVAVLGDIMQMFVYFYILEGAGVNNRLGKLISKRFPSQESIEKTNVVKKVKRFGYLGITVLAALPIYFGGMYSAVLVSHLMRLHRKKSYIFLTIGSMIGSAVLVLGISFLWDLMQKIFSHI